MTSYIQPLVQPVVDAAKAVPGTVVAKASIALGSQPLSSLCSPMQLGDLTLRNRNIMASLTRNRSTPTTVPNDANILYYKQRAEGRCGLILNEGTLICQQGTEWPHAPGIWSEEQVQGWKAVTDAVHGEGGVIFCQLWHVGRVAHPDMPEQKAAQKPVPGPSAIAASGGKFRDLPGKPGYVTPTELSDPRVVIEEYRQAAVNAKKAGFDGVELHSANGYLVHQFLDSTSNKRTDEWGGSVENRCRFGLEILKVLIEVWGPARVGIKLTPCAGYNDVGMALPETITTFVYYITKISAMKIAYVQLVRYVPIMDLADSSRQTDDSDPNSEFKRGIPHDVLGVYGPLIKVPKVSLKEHKEEQIRGEAMPDPSSPNPTPTRLFLNGAITPLEANHLIDEGLVDAVVFGTLWIGNPDLQKRIEGGLDVGAGINGAPDTKTFYQAPSGNPHEGYTDYKTSALA